MLVKNYQNYTKTMPQVPLALSSITASAHPKVTMEEIVNHVHTYVNCARIG